MLTLKLISAHYNTWNCSGVSQSKARDISVWSLENSSYFDKIFITSR